MAESLFGGSRTDAVGTGGLSSFHSAAPGLDFTSVEAQTQWTMRVPGTIKLMQAQVDASGTGRKLLVRKNGGNGTVIISPTDTTAGTFSDNTHSDHFAAGDTMAINHIIVTGSPYTIFTERLVFVADNGHAALYGGLCGVPASVSTGFFAIGGRGLYSTTEINQQNLMRVAGTLSNLNIFVLLSTATATTVVSRINGVTGTLSVTVTGGATGAFEDASHSDIFNAGDKLGFQVSGQSATGFNTLSGCAVSYTQTSNDIMTARSSSAITFSASNQFIPIIGNVTNATLTEANTVVTHGFAGSCSRLRIFLSANSFAGTSTLALRVAGATKTQTVSISSGATGWIEDTTHTDTFLATDNVDYIFTGGTSGSATYQSIMMTESPSVSSPLNIEPMRFRPHQIISY